jgi:hypothetical protein
MPMWRITRHIELADVAFLLAWGAAGAASPQTPTLVPFDNSLSVYVAHKGTWHNHRSTEVEALEVEDVVAVFRPSQRINDASGVWPNHQINEPHPPCGWIFIEPVEDEPMELHVIVRDAQKRLGKVVIANRVSGRRIAVLRANAAGSELDGSVPIRPDWAAFNLIVRDKDTGAVLVRIGADNPRVLVVVAMVQNLGWEPNRGDDHEGLSCPANVGPPWGDPRSTEGKEVTNVPVRRQACGGLVPFVNDSPNPTQVSAKYSDLLDSQIVKDTIAWPLGLPPLALAEIGGKVRAAREPFADGRPFLKPLNLLPFSQGVGHWPMLLVGELNRVICHPYYGRGAKTGRIDEEGLRKLPAEVVGEVWGLRAPIPREP